MASYRFNVDALNDIVVDYGGAGGHADTLAAFNAWAVLLGGAGGHRFSLNAANEVAVQVGGSGAHVFTINALNEICGILGGATNHRFNIDALNEIADLPVFGGVINLSASTIAEDASVGDLVGLLSVSNGSGTYAFTLTNDAGGLFALDGVDDTRLEVASALSAGSESITVEADNGVDPVISRSFLITVTEAVVVLPTAPVLAMDPLWTSADSTPDFTADFDATVEAGDDFRLQIQAAGGDWSSPVSDTTHTITAPEDTADEASLSNGSLSNGNYEARCNVTDGILTSNWSNTVSFTVAATGTDSIELEDTTDLIELEDTTDTIELEAV